MRKNQILTVGHGDYLRKVGSQLSAYYLFTDNLGSVTRIIRSNGAQVFLLRKRLLMSPSARRSTTRGACSRRQSTPSASTEAIAAMRC